MSPVQSSSPVSSEGPEPGVLIGLIPFDVPVVAPAALGGSKRLVQRTGEARDLDEGLVEHGHHVVALGSALGQLAANMGKDVRAQVGDWDPGQDEEPRVVDDVQGILLGLLRSPSDEAVAGREPTRCRAEAEHGEPPAVATVDAVTLLDTDQGLVAEAAVASDEPVPPLALVGAAHQRL